MVELEVNNALHYFEGNRRTLGQGLGTVPVRLAQFIH